MTPLRYSLGALALLALQACQPAGDAQLPPPGPQGQPSADREVPGAEGTTKQATSTVLDPAEQIQGDWDLELSATQQRQRELLELAFRDPPPSETELEELELGPEEQLMLGMVMMGRQQHPDRAADPEVLRGLEELSNASLTISADSLVFTHGQARQEASYTVAEEGSSSVSVQTTTTREGQPVVERVEILLDGADHLVLRVQDDPSGAEQRFVRRASQERAEPAEGPKEQPGEPSQTPPGAPPQASP